MKIKITRPDGTIIDAEGTAEECATALRLLKPDNVPLPIIRLAPWAWGPAPYQPTWTIGVGTFTTGASE